MDKYRRVEKPKVDQNIGQNEIRVTAQGKMRNYITYATSLLQEKKSNEVILKAMGRAINKTVTIAEIIKRRIPGLHQITSIDSTDITDVWEPIEEGLNNVETTRHVSSLQIILSTKVLDTSQPGYQPPLPADQIKPILSSEAKVVPRPRGRGRGRGRTVFGRGRGFGGGRGFGRGRGRGRGRGFGRGRGGQGSVATSLAEGLVGSEGPIRGRGRGRGYGRGRGRGRGLGRGRGRGLSRGRGRGEQRGNNNQWYISK